MNSIKYFTCLSLFLIHLFASPAYADCKSSKQSAVQKVEQISTQMRGASACLSNTLSVQALEINLGYLNNCPSADPYGYKHESVLVSLEQAKKAKTITCN